MRRIGDGHLALALADGAGGRLDAVAFRAFEGPLGGFLAGAPAARAHLAGRLERDDWDGRVRVKLHVEDAGPGVTPCRGSPARGRAGVHNLCRRLSV